MKTPTCNCGTATHAPHETATQGCIRRVVPAPTPAGKHHNLGCEMWYIKGERRPITDHTLRHQRGYHQHENGTWTSHGDSVNSLEA